MGKSKLSLSDAIKHYEEVADQLEGKDGYAYTDSTCDECAKEHRQLAEWLKKLQAYEEAKERIIEVSWEHTFTFSDGTEPMIYKICALDTVLEILGGER